MPRQKKTARLKKRNWTAAELKILRKRAGKISAVDIAREIKRTRAAVQRKATSQGIPLRRQA